MTNVFPGRDTAEIDELLVVFLIGMRVNRLFAVRKWLRTARAMNNMLRALRTYPRCRRYGFWRVAVFHNTQNTIRTAGHDLGPPAGNLLLEATARGLFVHQMIGILLDKARELYGIPEGYEVWTGLAIGYNRDPTRLDRLRARDLASRQCMPLSEFVFGSKWGNPSPLVLKQ
jgi:hypothetical protein